MLPKEFTERMKHMLGEEYDLFLTSYDQEKYQALRVNPLKSEKQEKNEELSEFVQKAGFTLTSVPWEKNGYYYSKEDTPGKHPYHEAGVYYIQEPSAMAPVPFLEVEPGDRVLDLCAAPGGKSTQIGAALKGEGLLVSNEIHPARAKILSENMERMGITNAIVTNESPEKLAAVFEGYFDKILVDAPCSGEGMFRKNEDAAEEWSPENVTICADRQDQILDQAAGMLRPGGRMVYSTCTFAPDENEGSISRFLERHPEFSILKVNRPEGFEAGRPEWCHVRTIDSNIQDAHVQSINEQDEKQESIRHTIRIWPHRVKGEGHYLAVLQKAGEKCTGAVTRSLYGLERSISEKEYGEFLEFQKENLKGRFSKKELQGVFLKFGDQLYLGPREMPALTKLKVLRPGLHLGTIKKNRFEPSHALALAMRAEEAANTYDLSAVDGSASAFIGGMTFSVEKEKGWHLITVDGYSLGWGKAAGGIMKNHYPKGLRK